MKPYETTHKCFKTEAHYSAIAMCREHLGDNDPYQLLQHRKWFTSPSWEIWIRNDCLDSIPATWFGLIGRHNDR